MSDLYFPRSLKPVVSKGYSMTRRNNVWSVDLAGGGVRQGRDTYYDVFPISVTLITSALGRQAFLSFLEKVDGGASSFWMAHDFGMGIEDYQVTITSTIAESTEDGINWTITFTATAEKSPFQDLENQCLINNLPDLYGCYGDCLGSFLKIYANYETTFPRIWSNEGPAGYPPINLLASTLDSRIVYDGPQVYYINRNGNLVQSATNEWPLTFIDGVAVGRVPPEITAENILPDSRDLNGANWSLLSRVIIAPNTDMLFNGVESSSLIPTTATGPHYMGGAIPLAPIGTKLTCSVIAKANTASTLQTLYFGGSTGVSELYANFDLGTGVVSAGSAEDKLIYPLGNGWYYCAMSVVITGDMSVNRQFIISPAASPLSTRLAPFTGDGVSGISVAHSQVEKSESPTSPIVTEASPTVRPTATAKVAMNGATSINITYSDGSVVNVPSVDDYATIPQADSAWGSKYITRIDFNVDS